MRDLISVKTNENGIQAVSARELHEFLEIGRDFTTWCKQMFEYGFVENIDYSEVYPESGVNPKLGGRPKIDYVLTLDCAKEISMLQRSEKGKQARLYFIECEKRLREIAQQPKFNLPKDYPSALRALADSEERRSLAEAKAEENEEDATIYREFINKIDCILIGDFCKLIGVKPNKFREWLRDNKYLMSGVNNNKPYQYYTHLFEVAYPECADGKVRQVTVLNKEGVNYFSKKAKKGLFSKLSK